MAARGRFDADSAVGFCETCPGQLPPDCNRERNRIERECGPSRGENRRFVKGRERYNNRRVPRNRTRRSVQERNMTWKDQHCGAALMQVNSSNLRERMEELNSLADDMFADIQQYAIDAGVQIAGERLERWALASGGRYAASALCGVAAGVGAAVCAGAATVVNVLSGIWNVFAGVFDARRTAARINDMVESLTLIRGNAEAVLRAADNPAELAQAQRNVSAAMAAAAEADDCLRARKCFLVPYDPPSTNNPQGPASMNQSGRGTSGLFDTGPLDLSDSRGCCPGQTGHHLIPRAMVDHCPGYNNARHNQAPTVCAEGANHSMGSHGQLHSAMDALTLRRHGGGEPMSMDDAMDNAVASMEDSGVGDNCREDCIRAQLERFYGDMNCTPNAVDRNGRPVAGNTQEDE
jgi:hypothetical protein